MATNSTNYDTILNDLAVGDIDHARLLLTEGAPLNLQKAAQVVISNGQCEALKFLIEECKLDVDKYYLLHQALLAGQEDIAKLLVISGANVNKCGEESEEYIDVFCREDYMEKLGITVSKGYELLYLLPLHLSVKCSIDMMCFLLQSGADVNKRNIQHSQLRMTALHMAVKIRNVEKMKLLIDHGADIEAKTDKNKTALICACDDPTVSSDCVQVLLENGANPNAMTGEYFTIGRGAVHFAIRSGNTHKLQLLIQHGAHLEARIYGGDTALILACKEPVPADCVKTLLENGAFPNVKNWCHQTPLTLATDNHDEEKISLLKQFGAAEEERSDQDETDLMSACQKTGDVESVKHLLENNASPNVKNKTGETAIHYAAQAGDVEKLKVLVQYKSDVNSMNDNGVTSLMKACEEVSVGVDCVRFLLEINALSHLTDIRGNTALDYAAEAKDLQKVKVLVENQADVNKMTHDGKAKLVVTCYTGYVDRDCVKFLIQNSTLPNVADWRRKTCLHWAAESGDKEMIDLLLSNEANVNAMTDKGETPLMLACAEEFVGANCVLSLLERGALPNLTNKDNKTAFNFAMKARHVKKVRFLLDYGATIDYNRYYLKAARNNDREFLELFHEFGADIPAEDSLGQNAIMSAVRGSPIFGATAAVQWLIDKGVSVNQSNKDGWTPLMAAVDCENTEIVRLLLEAGADVHAIRTTTDDISTNETTALSQLLDNNRICCYECVELLIRAGAVNSLPRRHNNLLHLMVKYDECRMIGLLLTHGMAPTLCRVPSHFSHLFDDRLDPVSPLTLALECGNLQIVQYLIDNMALCPCDINGHLYYSKLRACLNLQQETDIVRLMDEFYSQPKSLFQLCCVTVSNIVGGVPGRVDRINSLPLPELVKKQLLFKNIDLHEDRMSDYLYFDLENWDQDSFDEFSNDSSDNDE